MTTIDSTATARLELTEANTYEIQRHHPRTGWFRAFGCDTEESGRRALGSLADLVGEGDQLSPETLALANPQVAR